MSVPPHVTFLRKVGGGLVMAALAQWLFYGERVGATLGGFVLVWCATLAVAVPAVRRGGAAVALTAAAMLALVLVEDANWLGAAMCWAGIVGSAALVRHRFDDASRWVVRVLALAASGPFRIVGDVRRVRRLPRGAAGLEPALRALALPLGGGVAFLALFASANPVLASAFGSIAVPSFLDLFGHLLFWSAVLALVWPSFRIRTALLAELRTVSATRPDLAVSTLFLSLASFNAVFALQNALDLIFLWSGAPLPAGVTLADYAHRGAYTLIATALIAGAFVLVALAPGSAAARSRGVRRLLVLWIAQNLLLVASSALRLGDYVDAYSLTGLRIAAFAWMALVAAGLVLICWRLLANRAAAWLINANALATLLVLTAANVTDLDAVAARWNVDHARRGDRLDLCYLDRLGPSALLPLVDLERRAGGPILRDRARYLRRKAQADLAAVQADWHGWTWRGARRLAAARAIVGADRASVRPAPSGRRCGGAVIPPPPPPPALTPLPSYPTPAPITPLTEGAPR